MASRRAVLSKAASMSFLGFGMGAIPGRTRSATSELPASHDSTGGKRDDRVQLVESDPEFGFNFSFWLATPETYRIEPVPLLFEMNNADEEDSYDKVKFGRAKSQITDLGFQGAWLSEELGVPHIKPIVPVPNGDPIDATHQTHTFDRETLLLDDTEFERLDRQLLRMADYARQEVLSDITTHEKLLFYGNSSEGVVSERMAALHPEHIIAAAGGGLNGFVLLPFEELGGYTLNYPVGVADFEAILEEAYDRDAHDGVDMFYFQGGQDPKNRLKMENGFGGHLWNDRQVYNAARAVYGADIVEDRFPRCHIAFEKAGIDAQFRIYPEMTHNPRPASHDLLDFYQKSIAGEDVSEFGQRLELPLDRQATVINQEQGDDGITAKFSVSGRWPPPERLVSYEYSFDDGTTATGSTVTHTFAEPGFHEVTLTMETAHGQRAETTTQHTFFDVVQTEISQAEALPGESVTASAEIRNPTQEAKRVTVGLGPVKEGVNGLIKSKKLQFDPGESKTVSFQHRFTRPGTFALSVDGVPVTESITVVEPEGNFTIKWDHSPAEPRVGEQVTVEVTVIFHDAGSGSIKISLLVDGESVGTDRVSVEDYTSPSVSFTTTFEEPGEYSLSAEESANQETKKLGTISVKPPETPTATEPEPTPTSNPTQTQTTAIDPETTETPGQPGFGVISAIAGIGSAVSYLLYRDNYGDD